MKNITRAAFIVRSPGYVGECVRSALGLAVESIEPRVYIIDAAIDAADPRLDDFKERLELLDDMEGRVMSNLPANSAAFPFIQPASLADIAGDLAEADLVISFGE
ncbi:MAG: hypothetical protein V1816_17360 [Pseudomonadota bacterium]